MKSLKSFQQKMRIFFTWNLCQKIFEKKTKNLFCGIKRLQNNCVARAKEIYVSVCLCMCVCVSVCTCVCLSSLLYFYLCARPFCLNVFIYLWARERVCVCVEERAPSTKYVFFCVWLVKWESDWYVEWGGVVDGVCFCVVTFFSHPILPFL